MKKIIIILLAVIPVLIFGQASNNGEIVDKFPINELQRSPLYIVDGIHMKSDFKPDNLDCDNIENIEVLEGAYSTAIYGARGANGVYIITTKAAKYKDAAHNIQVDKKMLTLETKLSLNKKDFPAPHSILDALQGRLYNLVSIAAPRRMSLDRDVSTLVPVDYPLIILDGIEMEESFDINQVPIADIHEINIYKEEQAIALFGTRAQKGVICISKTPPIEYETIVFAPGYESFLATQKSKDFYSESYLKTKNMQMVIEWNYRYRNPSIYNPKIYEAAIDYESKIDYGLDVEYELYMFFRFMEKENRMSLINDRVVAGL